MTARARCPDARDITAEIIRRAASEGRYVVRLGKPPTFLEQLQLIAARLEGKSVAILPHQCKTTDEWLERYGWMKGR